MKKIIIVILLVFSFINVKALTSVRLEWVPNVYYNYKKNGVIHWGQFAYIYADNKPVYCMDITSEVTENIYNSSTDISQIPIVVQTSSYFGYGYMDNNRLEDYMATQALIWHFLGWDVYFTTKSGGAGTVINIDSYKEKINHLLDSYGWFPYFDSDFHFEVGKVYVINDMENLMSDDYLIYNDSNNYIGHVDNGILVKTYDAGNFVFGLERIYKKYDTSMVYTANNSQKLFYGKELESIYRDYYYDVRGSTLDINVSVSEYNDYIKLEDNVFELYDENNKFIGMKILDNSGFIEFNNLNLGKYILKHTIAINGIEKHEDTIIYVESLYSNCDIVLKPVHKNITITKRYGNSKIGTIYNDTATFNVYDSNNNLIDVYDMNDGIISNNLLFGEYNIIDNATDINYEISKNDFNDDIHIDIYNDVYNAKLKIDILDIETNEKIDNVKVHINDKEYISNNGIITDVFESGNYELVEDKIDGYYELSSIPIVIDENSEYVLIDNEVYINIIIYNEKELVVDDTIEEDTNYMELPNLGEYLCIKRYLYY